MQNLRNVFEMMWGFCRIRVDVWHRCPVCNQKLIERWKLKLHPNKPSVNSIHQWAEACDCHVDVKKKETDPWRELPSEVVVDEAQKLGANNLGMYDTFSHVGKTERYPFIKGDNRTKKDEG